MSNATEQEDVSGQLTPFDDPNIKAAFDAYPAPLRKDLLRLRELILDTASRLEAVGQVVETIKWGQPAYRPTKPKTGTTVRIDALRNSSDRYGFFVHCQTTLLEDYRALYPDTFETQGNRALLFSQGQSIDAAALEHCIALALTYHLKGET